MANLELAAAFGAADAAKEQDLRGYYPMAARVLAEEVRRLKTERDSLAREAQRQAGEIERKAGYWRAFTFAVSTRGATLAKVNDRRGRECWECTVGRSTVQRLSAESAIHGALWLEFDGNVPESFGLPKSTLRPLVWSGS